MNFHTVNGTVHSVIKDSFKYKDKENTVRVSDFS